MTKLIGIDLGTSATKFLLVDEKGNILKSISKEYPVIYPHSGWSEQNPEEWWNAVKTGVPELSCLFQTSLPEPRIWINSSRILLRFVMKLKLRKIATKPSIFPLMNGTFGTEQRTRSKP